MGYRISYQGGAAEKISVRSRKKLKWIPFVAVLFMLAMTIFPAGRLTLWNIFLPGNEAVTAEALESLAAELMAGEPLGDAVEAFCLEIIHGS